VTETDSVNERPSVQEDSQSKECDANHDPEHGCVREDQDPDISVSIPGEFLEPGTETGGEILARDQSGNQTITALPSFSTSG
jgi:hypothetical protein